MAEPQLADVPPLPPGLRHHIHPTAEIHRNLNELKQNFGNAASKWKYEGLESFSQRSIVVRMGVKEGMVTKTRYRRLVIKRAFTEMSEDTLRNEIETIESIHPAEHILNPLVTHEYAPLPGEGEGEGEGAEGGGGGAGGAGPAEHAADEIVRLFRRVRLGAREAIRDPHIPSALRRRREDRRMTSRRLVKEANLTALNDYPYMISEYLENGTLDRMLLRAAYHRRPVPNRVLWSVALCMLRACVGIAYGRPSPEDYDAARRGEITDTRLETVPPDAGNPRGLVHGAIDRTNFVFGSPGGFPEHDLVPSLKLIDFSQSYMVENAAVVKDHLMEMGGILLQLAVGDYSHEILTESIANPSIQNGIWTTATALYELQQGDNVDMDLKNLIGYWMSIQQGLDINLQHMLPLVEQAVETRNEAFYPGVPRETDASVRAFLQLMVYDADDRPHPFLAAAEAIPHGPLPVFFPPPDGFGDGVDGPADGDDDDDDDFGGGQFHAPPDFPDPNDGPGHHHGPVGPMPPLPPGPPPDPNNNPAGDAHDDLYNA
ncbi:uncharacterized protein F4812DRAFT_463822 [Daldinia caldariorum]|uniref:uncharacterized protein n=1 Tax=Daldinia caldariorum TaxID=326644 RepID=UPI002008CA6B|nr:uncharacterized protein F4812DRAFT_463822 [Daldinia caldariorum]KAI1463286.1 hypothetical protein F4812DRAFT_463822 [Daldinia caldariorum]